MSSLWFLVHLWFFDRISYVFFFKWNNCLSLKCFCFFFQVRNILKRLEFNSKYCYISYQLGLNYLLIVYILEWVSRIYCHQPLHTSSLEVSYIKFLILILSISKHNLLPLQYSTQLTRFLASLTTHFCFINHFCHSHVTYSRCTKTT